MIKDMKKLRNLLLLLLMGACLVSCNKKEKEWNYLFGYTCDDLIGTYRYSNASDAFSLLKENDYCHLCEDAQVTVNPSSSNTVDFRLVFPDHNFQKNFLGRPNNNANSFLVSMYSGWIGLKRYGLSADVLTNAQDEVRLKGFVTEDRYNRKYNDLTQTYDTLFDYSIKYYFDVIKN